MARISILAPPNHASRFDRFNRSTKVTLSEGNAKCETRDKWGSIFLDHPGVSAGKMSFAVTITSAGQGCGAGIGFADPRSFRPQTRNLGAAEASW
jgi:hypothetical protein